MFNGIADVYEDVPINGIAKSRNLPDMNMMVDVVSVDFKFEDHLFMFISMTDCEGVLWVNRDEAGKRECADRKFKSQWNIDLA